MRFKPFWSGIQFAGWEEVNCARCANSGQESAEQGGEYHWGTCAMEDALTEACIDDGNVDAALAAEYGFTAERTPVRCAKWRSER